MSWLSYIMILLIMLLFRRYHEWMLTKLIAVCFKWKSVKLTGFGWFRIQHIEIGVCDGFSVEIHDLQLSSSFVNQEHWKPIMISIATLKIEKQNVAKENNNEAADELSLEKHLQILQWAQYVDVKVRTLDIVLHDALPDCLLHTTFDNLCLETDLQNDILQLVVSYSKIHCNILKNTSECLLDFCSAGSVSLDVAYDTGKLNKISINVRNPEIKIYDGIIDYINQLKSSNAIAVLIQLLLQGPNIGFNIDNLMIHFIASLNVPSPRTLSMNLQTLLLLICL